MGDLASKSTTSASFVSTPVRSVASDSAEGLTAGTILPPGVTAPEPGPAAVHSTARAAAPRDTAATRATVRRTTSGWPPITRNPHPPRTSPPSAAPVAGRRMAEHTKKPPAGTRERAGKRMPRARPATDESPATSEQSTTVPGVWRRGTWKAISGARAACNDRRTSDRPRNDRRPPVTSWTPQPREQTATTTTPTTTATPARRRSRATATAPSAAEANAAVPAPETRRATAKAPTIDAPNMPDSTAHRSLIRRPSAARRRRPRRVGRRSTHHRRARMCRPGARRRSGW